jgi:hypothetical protein
MSSLCVAGQRTQTVSFPVHVVTNWRLSRILTHAPNVLTFSAPDHDWLCFLESQSYFRTGRLPPISLPWCQGPWDPWLEIFFQLNSCGNSPYAISSLTKRWVCLLWICLAFSQVYISHMQHVTKHSSFCTTHKSSAITDFAEQIMPTLPILCYNGRLVTWTVVSLTTAKFKFLIFSLSGFTLSYTANMFILMIL